MAADFKKRLSHFPELLFHKTIFKTGMWWLSRENAYQKNMQLQVMPQRMPDWVGPSNESRLIFLTPADLSISEISF